MVKQGDIIKINLNPKKGHEEMGYRPYVCLSNKTVIKFSNIGVFAPISNTKRDYPFYIAIPAGVVKTQGKVLLDQLVAIDFNSREYRFVETCPELFTKELLLKARVIFEED